MNKKIQRNLKRFNNNQKVEIKLKQLPGNCKKKKIEIELKK